MDVNPRRSPSRIVTSLLVNPSAPDGLWLATSLNIFARLCSPSTPSRAPPSAEMMSWMRLIVSLMSSSCMLVPRSLVEHAGLFSQCRHVTVHRIDERQPSFEDDVALDTRAWPDRKSTRLNSSHQ